MSSEIRFTSSIVERMGLVVFVTLIATLVWITHPVFSSPGNALNTGDGSLMTETQTRDPSCPSCSPAKPRVIYAPLFDLPEASGSEIVLNCRSGGRNIAVTPTFYTLEGRAIVGDDIIMHPAEIRFVNTKSLIPEKERDRRDWGGMSFSYVGGFMEAWAQLTLHGINGGGSVNVLFTVMSQRRSNASEAVWWVPRKGNSAIALGNTSAEQVEATLIFSNHQTRIVKIEPFATEIVRLNDDNLGRLSSDHAEAVSISYRGPSGCLIPTGYTNSANGKFASMIRFYDTARLVQQNLYANNLRVDHSTPYMVLRNTSSDYITATPTFHPEMSTSDEEIELGSRVLAPYETTAIDLSDLVKKSAKSQVQSVNAKILNSGKPGSLIGALYSINNQTGVSYDVPLRDSGPPRASTGGYPVRLDGDYTTVIAINNPTEKPGAFTMHINHEGGRYVIGMVALNPGETKKFDLLKIRDQQIPDINGQTLPRTMKTAQAIWSVRGNVRLNGRSEVVSVRDDVSSSYSCFLCCPNSFGAGWISPDSPTVSVGDSQQLNAWEQDVNGYYCGGNQPPYQVGATWWTWDTSVATVNWYGNVTAVNPGWATIAADWPTTTWEWDDIDESCNEYDNFYEATATVTVPCNHPTGESTASGGWADAEGYPTIHRWSQTLSPTSTSFAGRYVTERDPGGGSDSCWFSGSSYAPGTSITGGTWAVGGGNIWQYDYVGWIPDAVTYYRNQGRAPCGFIVPQRMVIDCPSGEVTYSTTFPSLAGDIHPILVTSRRAEGQTSRSWP